MKGAFLGPEFSNHDIENTARKYGANFTLFENFDEMTKKVATLLDEGTYLPDFFQY